MDVDDENEEERARAQAAFDAERGPSTQVEITLRCRSLVPAGEDFDRCDPMVQVRRKNNFTGNFEVVGATEHLHGVANPEFETTFTIDYYAEEPESEFKLTVYDQTDVSVLNVSEALGSAKFDMHAVLEDGQRQVVLPLLNKDGEPFTTTSASTPLSWTPPWPPTTTMIRGAITRRATSTPPPPPPPPPPPLQLRSTLCSQHVTAHLFRATLISPPCDSSSPTALAKLLLRLIH